MFSSLLGVACTGGASSSDEEDDEEEEEEEEEECESSEAMRGLKIIGSGWGGGGCEIRDCLLEGGEGREEEAFLLFDLAFDEFFSDLGFFAIFETCLGVFILRDVISATSDMSPLGIVLIFITSLCGLIVSVVLPTLIWLALFVEILTLEFGSSDDCGFWSSTSHLSLFFWKWSLILVGIALEA